MTRPLAVRAFVLAAAVGSLACFHSRLAVAQGVDPSNPASAALKDLQLLELPAQGSGSVLAVFLSGDGGWASLDDKVSGQLAAHGVSVVGFNQRAYLWNAKTPEQAGADLARIITAYRAKWHRDSVIVVGYSRGAGIAPFAVNRLPADVRATISAVVLIGPETGVNFHFKFRDLIKTHAAPGDLPVLPEVRKFGSTRLVCIHGSEEKDSLCHELSPPSIVVQMTGGHHFDGEYEEIGTRIVETLSLRP